MLKHNFKGKEVRNFRHFDNVFNSYANSKIMVLYYQISGLKDLADFLPASLATIVSYFSAEVTRGVWKPVFMNGTDWPSPAANLSNVEEQIKKILAATGVDVPSLVAGFSPLLTVIKNVILSIE